MCSKRRSRYRLFSAHDNALEESTVSLLRSVTSVRFPILILLTRGRLSEEKMINETSVMF